MSLFSSIRSLWTRPAAPDWPAFPDDRPSIFRALEARRAAAGDILPLAPFDLPDQARYDAAEPGGARWAPGALDGVFSHHMGGDGDPETAAILLTALQEVCARTSVKAALALYDKIPKTHVFGALDPLLGALASSGVDPERLHAVARWLATENPDREPVKLGIALLGALNGDDDLELILTLGSHDEFTLYSAVAVAGRLEPKAADRALWRLARMTDGWGRIQAIERISEAPAAEIADWILREGHANWVMREYTALACATKGGLLAALQAPAPDDDLLTGAGEILSALTNEQPGPWMVDYDDGAAATALWIERQAPRPERVRRLIALRRLRDFLGDEARDWATLALLGWTPETRRAGAEAADASIRDPRWRELISRELEADDLVRFREACEAAPEFGLDPWPRQFARQRASRGEFWWNLMQTRDPARAEQVAALLPERFDLDRLTGGPALDMHFGDDPEGCSALDFVVQELRRFPGVGAKLVVAALKSPNIRTRNMAVNALSDWPREAWSTAAGSALDAAIAAEPDPVVRGRMEAVRDGRALGD